MLFLGVLLVAVRDALSRQVFWNQEHWQLAWTWSRGFRGLWMDLEIKHAIWGLCRCSFFLWIFHPENGGRWTHVDDILLTAVSHIPASIAAESFSPCNCCCVCGCCYPCCRCSLFRRGIVQKIGCLTCGVIYLSTLPLMEAEQVPLQENRCLYESPSASMYLGGRVTPLIWWKIHRVTDWQTGIGTRAIGRIIVTYCHPIHSFYRSYTSDHHPPQTRF